MTGLLLVAVLGMQLMQTICLLLIVNRLGWLEPINKNIKRYR